MGGTIAILPTYNERENIEAVLGGVLTAAEGIEALVVDDDSPDGTARVVEERFGGDSRVHLLVRKERRGRGYAGVAGFRWAVERGYDNIIEMDADGSHNPKYLPGLIEALERADVSVCSRLVRGGGETGRGAGRRIITALANMYLRIVLSAPVRDCTTGYRGFRREVLESVPWEKVSAGGPAIVQEILYIALRNGYRVVEIPFIFEERRAGRSKLNFRLLARGLIEAVMIRARHSGHRR